MLKTADHNGAARAAGARAEEALRHKASQLQKFLDDVEELLGRLSNMDEPDIAKLRTRVESSIGRMKESVLEGAHTAIDSTRKAALATDEYVHRKPWVAIGAGTAAGVLVGALLTARRR